MKNIKNLILTGAIIALIPLSAIADDDEGKGFHHAGMLGYGYFEDKIFAEKFKEANYEFEGRVDQRPKDSLSGTWVISGIKVIVNDKTFISHSEDKIKVGDDVGILAKRENGKITALDLSQDD